MKIFTTALIVALLSTVLAVAVCVIAYPGLMRATHNSQDYMTYWGIGWRSDLTDRLGAKMFTRVDTFGWPVPALSSEWQWDHNRLDFRSDARLLHGVWLHDPSEEKWWSFPLAAHLWPMLMDIAFWFAVWSVLVFGFVQIWNWILTWKRVRKHKCRHCGYSREGAHGVICSECGADTSVRRPVVGRAQTIMLAGVIVQVLMLSVLGVMAWEGREKVPAVFTAIQSGRLDDARKAFLALDDPNTLFDQATPDAYGESVDVSALMYAAAWDDAEFIRFAIENGADVDGAGSSARTPLWWAAGFGSDKAVQLLIEKGADVNTLSGGEYSVLWSAVYHGNLKSVKLLLAAGADPNLAGGSGVTPLMYVNGSAHQALLVGEALIQAGAEINESKGPRTPLAAACASTDDGTEWTDYLIDHGADVNLHDNRRQDTALHKAATCGNCNAIRLLVQHGAEVNATNMFGETPLYDAVSSDKPEAVRVLVVAGADASFPVVVPMSWPPLTTTALHWAVQFPELNHMLPLLIQSHPNLNVVDSDGRTPLILAAQRHQKEAVGILLMAGADESIKDSSGWTYKAYLKK